MMFYPGSTDHWVGVDFHNFDRSTVPDSLSVLRGDGTSINPVLFLRFIVPPHESLGVTTHLV